MNWLANAFFSTKSPIPFRQTSATSDRRDAYVVCKARILPKGKISTVVFGCCVSSRSAPSTHEAPLMSALSTRDAPSRSAPLTRDAPSAKDTDASRRQCTNSTAENDGSAFGNIQHGLGNIQHGLGNIQHGLLLNRRKCIHRTGVAGFLSITTMDAFPYKSWAAAEDLLVLPSKLSTSALCLPSTDFNNLVEDLRTGARTMHYVKTLGNGSYKEVWKVFEYTFAYVFQVLLLSVCRFLVCVYKNKMN
jgi:hypothetical protein